MSQAQDRNPSPSTRVVGRRVAEFRGRKGWSARELAERVERETGVPMRRDTIANLENGRRDRITVDELLALAYSLNCSPLHLLAPRFEELDHDQDPGGAWPFPENQRWTHSHHFKEWLRGEAPIREVETADDKAWAAGERLAREFHSHAEQPELYEVHRHPAARDLTTVLAVVEDFLLNPDGFNSDLWREAERGLRMARRRIELLQEEDEARRAELGRPPLPPGLRKKAGGDS